MESFKTYIAEGRENFIDPIKDKLKKDTVIATSFFINFLGYIAMFKEHPDNNYVKQYIKREKLVPKAITDTSNDLMWTIKFLVDNKLAPIAGINKITRFLALIKKDKIISIDEIQIRKMLDQIKYRMIQIDGILRVHLFSFMRADLTLNELMKFFFAYSRKHKINNDFIKMVRRLGFPGLDIDDKDEVDKAHQSPTIVDAPNAPLVPDTIVDPVIIISPTVQVQDDPANVPPKQDSKSDEQQMIEDYDFSDNWLGDTWYAVFFRKFKDKPYQEIKDFVSNIKYHSVTDIKKESNYTLIRRDIMKHQNVDVKTRNKDDKGNTTVTRTSVFMKAIQETDVFTPYVMDNIMKFFKPSPLFDNFLIEYFKWNKNTFMEFWSKNSTYNMTAAKKNNTTVMLSEIMDNLYYMQNLEAIQRILRADKPMMMKVFIDDHHQYVKIGQVLNLVDLNRVWGLSDRELLSWFIFNYMSESSSINFPDEVNAVKKAMPSFIDKVVKMGASNAYAVHRVRVEETLKLLHMGITDDDVKPDQLYFRYLREVMQDQAYFANINLLDVTTIKGYQTIIDNGGDVYHFYKKAGQLDILKGQGIPFTMYGVDKDGNGNINVLNFFNITNHLEDISEEDEKRLNVSRLYNKEIPIIKWLYEVYGLKFLNLYLQLSGNNFLDDFFYSPFEPEGKTALKNLIAEQMRQYPESYFQRILNYEATSRTPSWRFSDFLNILRGIIPIVERMSRLLKSKPSRYGGGMKYWYLDIDKDSFYAWADLYSIRANQESVDFDKSDTFQNLSRDEVAILSGYFSEHFNDQISDLLTDKPENIHNASIWLTQDESSTVTDFLDKGQIDEKNFIQVKNYTLYKGRELFINSMRVNGIKDTTLAFLEKLSDHEFKLFQADWISEIKTERFDSAQVNTLTKLFLQINDQKKRRDEKKKKTRDYSEFFKEIHKEIAKHISKLDTYFFKESIYYSKYLDKLYLDDEDAFSDQLDTIRPMNANYYYEKRKKMIDEAFFTEVLSKTSLYDSKIAPLERMKPEKLKQILSINNFQVSNTKETRMRLKKDETTKEFVKRFVAKLKEVHGDDTIPPLQAEEIVMTDLEKEQATANLSVHYSPKFTHGNVGVEIIDSFNVTFKHKEHEIFKAQYPTPTIVPAFHGTDPVAASFILRFGFAIVDRAIMNVNGRMMGNGIYFSNILDKCAQYLRGTGSFASAGTRRQGNIGYIFEMEAYLGEKGRDSKEAGTGKDSIRSPEWVVFDPRAQLDIKKVHKVRLTKKTEMLKLAKKHGVNVAQQEYHNRLASFSDYLMEKRKEENIDCISFVFRAGQIPYKGELIEFEEFNKKLENVPNVHIEYSQKGPVLMFHNDSDLNDVIDITNLYEFLHTDPEGKLSQLQMLIQKYVG